MLINSIQSLGATSDHLVYLRYILHVQKFSFTTIEANITKVTNLSI